MRVQLLTTLRGTKGEKPIVWIKGTILDDSVKPIPGDILRAVKMKKPSVLVLGDTVEITGDIKAANERIAELTAELKSAGSRISELEELDEIITKLKKHIEQLEAELASSNAVESPWSMPKPSQEKTKSEKIQELLNDADLTQAEIAKKLETTPQYVSNVAKKMKDDNK